MVSRSERPPAAAGPSARRLTERAFRIRESGIIVVLVVFVAITTAIQPRFLNITNIQFILINTTVFALLALGETMVVISRNYDLSVGSVLGLSAYLSANLFGQHHGIPILAIAIAVGIGIGAYYLRSYRSGRELYAIGSNPDAARLAGIPVGRRVFVAFTVSGAIAGIAGVLWAAQYGTIDSTAGTGYELQVISAVVVGGVAIFGGSGSAVGAALGALLLNTISSALYVLGISPFWDQAIWGFLLLLAISVDRFIAVRLAVALRVRGGRHE